MKRSRLWILILAFGAIIVTFVFLFHFTGQNTSLHSNVVYSAEGEETSMVSISDESVPLAAAVTDETNVEVIPIYNDLQPVNEAQHTVPMPITQQNGSNEITSVEPVVSTPVTEEPNPQNQTEPEPPAEETAPPTEPETPATPEKAVKPSDITDVKSMAKYIYDAATEFWAVEKNFCGTSTRPVSTRVASSIGAGTSVDCPGGDTVRIDKSGVAHDSYAIGEHFRDYIDMPDLQNFKIFLSDKDYSENIFGAREEVVGSYYQYGSQRETYEPEVEPVTESETTPG